MLGRKSSRSDLVSFTAPPREAEPVASSTCFSLANGAPPTSNRAKAAKPKMPSESDSKPDRAQGSRANELRSGIPAPLKKRAYEFKLTRVREVGSSRKVDSPALAHCYWREVIEAADWFQANKEHLVVLLLNTRHNIDGHSLISIGTLNESLAHPRDILAPVVCGGAYGFILMHNHPSGDPSPSQADRQLTRRIADGAETLGVKLLDHVIAGRAAQDREPYFSFREMGLL